MDVAGLRDRIQATLDANAAIRQQAELDLKHAEEQPGFTDGLLNILEQEQDNAVRLSSKDAPTTTISFTIGPSSADA
jgi:hypothetical protein